MRRTFREIFLDLAGQYEAKVKEREEGGACSKPDACEGCELHGYCANVRQLARQAGA
jgi:hypothetical protein